MGQRLKGLLGITLAKQFLALVFIGLAQTKQRKDVTGVTEMVSGQVVIEAVTKANIPMEINRKMMPTCIQSRMRGMPSVHSFGCLK